MEELSRFAEFARTLAAAARAETMRGWREAGHARNKAEGGRFDPVTESDEGAERAIRALIERHYPDHGIVGEEFGERQAEGAWSWSLDPIDGTRSFVCGLPSWSTLIALLHRGQPVLGLIDIPRLGESYIGHDGRSSLRDADGDRPLSTSRCSSLAEARFSTTDPYLFEGVEQESFTRLRTKVRVTRYGLDAYAYARLAAGSIDLVVESGLKPHDYNALVPVIRGAGGAVANWRGEDDFSEGHVVAAATQELLEEAVRALNDIPS